MLGSLSKFERKSDMHSTARKSANFICVVLLVLSVLAAAVKCFTGFDIDEGYAVSMPYRLLQGDHMFLDMWEVHQTSSFLPALFLSLFYKITGGMNGSVLYLRAIATLLHAAVSLAVFRSLRKNADTAWAVLLALLYFNLLPKWLISLDFSMQKVWGMTLLLLVLEQEVKTGKRGYAFLMGVVLAMTVLAYPGMVLAYPALGVSIWMLHRDKKVKERFNKIAIMTLGCAVMAVLFLGYVLSAMGISDFIESIPMVFMDGTHQFTVETKLMLYAAQWLNVGKQLLILCVPGAVITTVIYVAVKRKYADAAWFAKETRKKMMSVLFILMFLSVTSVLVIFANAVGIAMGPFHFQVRYLLYFIFVFVLCISELRKHGKAQVRFLFWGPMFQMIIAFVAILIFSNVGPDSSSSYLGIGLVAGGWLLYKITSGIDEKWEKMTYMVLALFVLSLVFCKGYYVRITEYGPSNIWEKRMQVQEGPLAGIYVTEEDYVRITDDYETIHRMTHGKEKLLYLGTEGISNLYARCEFVSPSTISTPAFNEQWVTYFEKYPEKEPDVIALAKNTIDNREKFFAENPLGIWIAQRYDVSAMTETDSLCMINKK